MSEISPEEYRDRYHELLSLIRTWDAHMQSYLDASREEAAASVSADVDFAGRREVALRVAKAKAAALETETEMVDLAEQYARDHEAVAHE